MEASHAELFQGILTASASDSTVQVLDCQTGTVSSTLSRESLSRERCVALLGSNGLVAAAQAHKAQLKFMSTRKAQQVSCRECSCPELLRGLAGTADGAYCAGGAAAGKCYVWDVASGALLRQWDAHYKAVTVLAFTDDGQLLITASEDAYVHVWRVARLVGVSPAERERPPEPLYSFSEHTLPVTGIAVGACGCAARVATAGLDRSCKLWSLVTGEMLASVSYPSAATAVAMDSSERELYVGGGDGTIYGANLLGGAPASRWGESDAVDDGLAAPTAEGIAFHGHTAAVTALVVTADGSLLVSASLDGAVRVWDVNGRQTMHRIEQHKGGVTNLLLLPPVSRSAVAKRARVAAPLRAFQRYVQAEPQPHVVVLRDNPHAAVLAGAGAGPDVWEMQSAGLAAAFDASVDAARIRLLRDAPAAAEGAAEAAAAPASDDLPAQLIAALADRDAWKAAAESLHAVGSELYHLKAT